MPINQLMKYTKFIIINKKEIEINAKKNVAKKIILEKNNAQHTLQAIWVFGLI